ncbi:hypothetical protein V491_05460 [Pseudogymnoascus sp. VKM F-3775]|nr:hypothetical protein V491_05460 [Pseudogymnoascus sp. VKM F-3775]
MPIISAEINAAPASPSGPITISNITSWMEDRLDRSKNLKQFTVFNELPPELRFGVIGLSDPWMRYSSSFHPDEDVIALPDNFFWRQTPLVFQICQESRYIGKLRIFPVTGLHIFHNRNSRFHPTFQLSTQSHPKGFFLKTLWFSPKDTIEIPIRDASLESIDIHIAAQQIARWWVAEKTPLKVRSVQFSFLVTNSNRLGSSAVERLTSISSLLVGLEGSATIFIGMGSGYGHRRGRFYLNDDQERWVYNDNGTFCNPELQKRVDSRPKDSPKWDLPTKYSRPNLAALTAELRNLDSMDVDLREIDQRMEWNIIPQDSQFAVSCYQDAFTYCLNSEIIEDHIRKVNPRIRYVDEIRAGLVKDGFAGGWERGEAWRRGLSFDTTALYEPVRKINGDDVSSGRLTDEESMYNMAAEQLAAMVRP